MFLEIINRMTNKILNRKKNNPYQHDFTGEKYSDETFIQLFKYDSENYSETNYNTSEKILKFEDNHLQNWLNIHGIHNVSLISELCKKNGIDNLIIQDILDVNQRPKFERYNNFIFLSIKTISPTEAKGISTEQISFILGNNYLISFQEKKSDYFEHIRYRIRNKTGIIRDSKVDFLFFLLIESILDNYFKTIDSVDKHLENLWISDTQKDPSPNILNSIEQIKRELYNVKKLLSPLKDFFIKIEREQFNFIQINNRPYFLELKDLYLSLIDECEKLELKADSSINLFFSVQGNRMNQVMKTLSIVATIFIPLTFIAGIYGMNFKYLPGQNWKWGFAGIWLIIIILTTGMLLYFKKKKWF